MSNIASVQNGFTGALVGVVQDVAVGGLFLPMFADFFGKSGGPAVTGTAPVLGPDAITIEVQAAAIIVQKA